MQELLDTDIGVSAFDSPTVLEAAYARIQREINSSEAATRAWKTRHNTLSIVSRIPVEVLSTIFQYTAEHRVNERSWIWVVSHVCSRWRHVALECPSLWDWISLNRKSEAAVILQRSRMTPLRMKGDLGFEGSPPNHSQYCATLVHSALAELSRIRELSLFQRRRNSPIGMGTVLESLKKPAPALQMLTLRKAPHLHTVTLQNVAFKWNLPFLRTLTSLCLLQCPREAWVSIKQVVSALEDMPNLKRLTLHSSLPSLRIKTTLPPPNRPSQLPRLIDLNIKADLLSCAHMVKYLAAPTATVRLNSKVPFEDSGSNIAMSVLSEMGRSLGRETFPIRCLSLQYLESEKHILIQTWDSPGTCLHIPKGFPRFEIKLSSPYPPSSPETLHSLFASLPLQKLETLHVKMCLLGKEQWLHWRRLVSLRNLRIEGNDTGFLAALCYGVPRPGTATQTGPGRVGSLRFKALRNLVLFDWLSYEGNPQSRDFDLLNSCLLARRKRGLTMHAIHSLRCVFAEDQDIEALRSVVKRVYWDKYFIWMDDDKDDDDDDDDDDLDDEDSGF